MRKIVWSEDISLDGVVEEPGEWSIPYFSNDLAQYKSDELRSKATVPLDAYGVSSVVSSTVPGRYSLAWLCAERMKIAAAASWRAISAFAFARWAS
jgi:hypothetical protein